jgi:hypothetical protein
MGMGLLVNRYQRGSQLFLAAKAFDPSHPNAKISEFDCSAIVLMV